MNRLYNKEDALDLLARMFVMSCDTPDVTMVCVWGDRLVGIDSGWMQDIQLNVLEGIFRDGAIPIGWLLLNEELRPVGLVIAPEWCENPIPAMHILEQAVKHRTGRVVKGFGTAQL